jgi:mercuric ion transport protein
MEQEADSELKRTRWLAVSGLVGAVLASSCCVAPLVLLTLGISGAWIGGLTALAPYQGYFTVVAVACLASGFWLVYWKPNKAYDTDSYCASPTSDRVIKTALWFATVLIGIAITVNWWTPLLN